jgi:uncharacterized protein YjeT (DUF2065 family)
MYRISVRVPLMAISLVIVVVLSGILPSAFPGHAQNNNLTTPVTVDQLISNLTQPNPESSLESQS